MKFSIDDARVEFFGRNGHPGSRRPGSSTRLQLIRSKIHIQAELDMRLQILRADNNP